MCWRVNATARVLPSTERARVVGVGVLVAEAGAVAEGEAWGVMDFGQHYRNILRPFQWTFTRDELARV